VVIAEALACGVPVITTKGTPWNELLAHRCGWWVDAGAEPLATAMREAIALTDEQRREMGKRGRCLVEERYSWPKIAVEMKLVYEWVLGGGTKPECVV
jgi:glycosyltransferase involved in cell wall biosynthesis